MSADDEIVEAELVEEETGLVFAGDLPLAPIAELRRGLLELDDTRQELARMGDVASLAYGVADIGALVSDLQNLSRSARDDMAKIMLAGHVDPETGKPKRGNPKFEVAGLGVVDVPGGSEWKDWDSPRLLRKLIHDVIYDGPELRHFDHPADVGEAIAEVIMACIPITPSLGWRVGQLDKVTQQWTGLRGAGIDPEDYADRTAKPRLAAVPKRADS